MKFTQYFITLCRRKISSVVFQILGGVFLFTLTIQCYQKDTDNPYKRHNFPFTCLAVPKSICLDQGSHIITLPNYPSTVDAYWSFDRLFAVDESGNGHHFHPGVRAGPSVLGEGSSAHLHPSIPLSRATFKVPQQGDLSFSISFWIYVMKSAPLERDEVFLTRGGSLSLALSSTGGHLTMKIEDLTLRSYASFLRERWTFIALSVTPQWSVSLYWNGAKDAHGELRSLKPVEVIDVTLGLAPQNVPSTSSDPLQLYIDNLRIYRGIISESEIQAQSLSIITGMTDPHLVTLGCLDCTLEEVLLPTMCVAPYHLCLKKEYYNFALRFARIQGFLKSNRTRVWSRDTLPAMNREQSEPGSKIERRLALCCGGCSYV